MSKWYSLYGQFQNVALPTVRTMTYKSNTWFGAQQSCEIQLFKGVTDLKCLPQINIRQRAPTITIRYCNNPSVVGIKCL